MIQPLAYVHPSAKISDHVIIDPFVTIHADVEIGEGTHVMSGATIFKGTRIGKSCRIFPGDPIMPGVLQLEAMAQCGGILVLSTVEDPENYGTYFLKIDNTKFKDKVVPGDTMIMKMELMEPVRRGLCIMRGRAWVGEKLVCESEMMAQIVKIA